MIEMRRREREEDDTIEKCSKEVIREAKLSMR